MIVINIDEKKVYGNNNDTHIKTTLTGNDF
jgi:hypothetical protein